MRTTTKKTINIWYESNERIMNSNVSKKEFREKHGFSMSMEACAKCRFPRGRHTVWNTDKDYDGHDFESTGKKHRA